MKLRWSSFRCAFSGVLFLLKTQNHARWHALISGLVIIFAGWLQVSKMEWLILLGMMALVWVTETLNTAIEQTCDAITLEMNPMIGRAKDLAAGAVLIAALSACVIGALILAPRLWLFLFGQPR